MDNYGFLVGLLIIAIVSFYDDVRPLPPKVRMAIQFVAVALMVVPMGGFVVGDGGGLGVDSGYAERV